MFQSLKGIIGDFNIGRRLEIIQGIVFQSLKGIIGDFNPARALRWLRRQVSGFQSLKGIIGDFNSDLAALTAGLKIVSIPERDYR